MMTCPDDNVFFPERPEIKCEAWDTHSAKDFGEMATLAVTGENGRKCRITAGSVDSACHWYVQYAIEGDKSDDWLGLTSVDYCGTKDGAWAWLKAHHKDICCGQPVTPGNDQTAGE